MPQSAHSLMTTPENLVILASKSPRRIQLLKEVIPDFSVIPSSAQEIFQPDLTPKENAIAVAGVKALDVANNHPGHFVIGADTIVVLGDEIIGKPKDADDACTILKRLSGQRHQVITGVVVVHTAQAQGAGVSRIFVRGDA